MFRRWPPEYSAYKSSAFEESQQEMQVLITDSQSCYDKLIYRAGRNEFVFSEFLWVQFAMLTE